MSKGGKGGSSNQPSGTTTSTQNSAPWIGQQPYLTGAPGTVAGNGLFPEAANLLANYTPQYFPSSTVADMNPTQNNALINQANYGAEGGPSSLGAANKALTGIENGGLVGPNPYLDQTVKSISDSIMPQVNSQFNMAGREGSGANQFSADSAIANAVAPLEFNDYETQIGNILKGGALAPAIGQGQQSAMQTGLDAGNQVQQQQQNQITDAVNRFNFQQQLPYNQLGTYQQMIGGNYGNSSTLTQPFFGQSGGKGGKGSTGSTLAAIAPIAAKAALTFV